MLKSLAAGESEYQIADRFNGDKQLVRMWKCFLIHNRWIEKKSAGGWQITSRGVEAMNKHRAEKISIQV